MLVLSRKQGQKLHFGDDIVVTVLEVHGGVVRLGIEAPKSVRVLRGELAPLTQLAQPILPCTPADPTVAV